MRLALAFMCLSLGLWKGTAHAAEPFRWTGFYLGAHMGAGSTTGRSSNSDYPTGTFASTFADDIIPIGQSLRSDTMLGGLLAGYAFQTGPLVIGVEADLSAGRSKGTALHVHPCGCGVINTLATQSMDWMSTVRGKLGVTPLPNLLVFGTAGLAIGRVENTFSSASDPAFFSLTADGSGVRTGFTYGGGAELALSSALSARLEYLHYDLGSETLVAPYTVLGFNAGAGIISQFRITGDIVRVGLAYRLQ